MMTKRVGFHVARSSLHRGGSLAIGVIGTGLLFLSSLAGQESPEPFGMSRRVEWTTSRIVGRPEPPPPYVAKRAFGQLKFKNPVYIVQEPGSDRLMVAELSGKVYAFDPSDAKTESRQLFLDAKREVYSFSFHPNYQKNGHVFVFSPRDPNSKSNEKQSRVSRFTAKVAADGDNPSWRRCSTDSEEIIIEWPAGGHNGGEAIIGPDGMLYVSTGDGTSGSDINNTGQGVDDLLAVIMRLDVDRPANGKPYSIPSDNPFVNHPGARPEIWAFGFRNPWRMSFDRRTGQLWVGDVGQDLWEMIWLVQRGGNYGWSVQEGTHPFHPQKKIGPGPILPPVIEHHHTECRSITGGYVYYGKKFPELQGVYFYGDYEYGKIWGLRLAVSAASDQAVPAASEQDGQKVVWQKELADTPLRIASFGVSRQGEIFLVDHPSGEIYTIERAPPRKANASFPKRLSETGLFQSTADHTPAAGVISYSVNAPQWLDHASKQRYIALPPGGKIKFVERGANANTWTFDDGAVAMETISLEMRRGDPRSQRRLETRILVKQENHWLGYSYLWNEQQTDGLLAPAAGTKKVLWIEDAHASGGRRRQTWRVPSRNECMVCHSRAAGFVLGLRTSQMNRLHEYPIGPEEKSDSKQTITDNQLRAFNHIGIFSSKLPKRPDQYDSLPNPYDEKADLTARARAYLHVNCSVCHVSDGGGNAKLQLWYYEKEENTNLINETPLHGAFGLNEAKIVRPGDPFASVLLYRFSKLGRGRMPHIGSQLVDERALEMLQQWIGHLGVKYNQKDSREYDQFVAFSSKVRRLAIAPREQRTATIGKLLQSTRTAFMLSRVVSRLAGAALGGDQPESRLRKQIVALGASHTEPDVRDLFERFLPESERTQRLGDQIDPQTILALDGDAERGRRFFFSTAAAQCKNCHKIKGQGGDLGPDLSQIAAKNKPAELLESLIDPSKKIDPKYATHLLTTVGGKVYSGILVEKTPAQIALNVLEDGVAKKVRIAAGDIEELAPQRQSLMPERLMRDLTHQQAADLIAFLASLK